MSALCVGIAPTVSARGQGEEQTLEERLAGEAAAIAEEYGRDPEDYAGWVRDEAEKVVEDQEQLPAAIHVFDIILDRYRQYNELGEEAYAMLNQLFDREISQTLSQDEINALRVAVIDKLDAMQAIIPFPSEYQQRQIDDLTFLLQLALDTARHDALMDRALAILHPDDGGEVSRREAIAIYSNEEDSQPGMHDAAMTLQIQYYDPNRYGSVVSSIIESVKNAIRAANEAMSGDEGSPGLEVEVLDAANAVVSLFEEGSASATSANDSERQVRFDEFLDRFTQVTAVTRSISEAADLLDAQIAAIAPTWPNTGNEKDDFHLLFVQDYLRGRSNVNEEEGIVYALESLAAETFDMVAVPAELQGRDSYSRSISGLDAETIDLDELNLEERLAEAARAEQVLELVVNGIVVRAGQPSTGIDEPAQYAALLDTNDATTTMALLARIQSAAELPALLNTFRNAVVEYQRGGTSVTTLGLRRESVQSGVDTLTRRLEEWNREAQRFAAVGAVAATADTTDVLEEHAAALTARAEQLRRLEIDLVDRIATLEVEAFNRTYRGRSAIVTGGILADIDRADSLIQGTEDDGWQKRSPDTAETILTTAQRELTSLLTEVQGFQTEYSAQRERDYVASADPIIAHVAAASLLESEINASATRVRELLAQARTLQQTALSTERTANSALQDAKDEIAIAEAVRDQDEVERAIAAAETAQETFLTSYRTSLNSWWRDPQAARWESEREALALAIGEAQRLLVRVRVNNYIEEADGLYDEERFEEAINILTDARNEWNNVFDDPNALLDLLLDRARNAATLTENIDIDMSEPGSQQNQLLLERALQLENEARETDNPGEREALVADARGLLDELFEDQPRNLKGRIAQIRLSFLVADDPNVEIGRRVADLQESFDRLSQPLREDERENALRDLTQAQAVQQVIADRSEVSVAYRTEISRLVTELERLLNPPPVTDDARINAILAQAYRQLGLTQGVLPDSLPPLDESVYDTVSALLESGLSLEGARIGELRALYQIVRASGAIQTWRADAEARYNEAVAAYRNRDYPRAVRLMEALWQDTRVRDVEYIAVFYDSLRQSFPELFRNP